MTDHKDGGPAFPKEHHTGGHSGMSLRDWFAGNAGEDDIAHYRERVFMGQDPEGPHYAFRYSRVEARYRYADAMLAERAKK